MSFTRFDTDPPHRPATPVRWLVASLLAVAGSLAVDALLVRLGTAIFPSTKGYDHFRFGDYATLTVIGVVAACLGWPVVARLCAAPRRLFGMLAVAVTVVLLLPDVLILAQGQPVRAVLVLMVMHVAIAVVTYGALVLAAPVRARRSGGVPVVSAS